MSKTLAFAFFYCLKCPDILLRVQEEIDRVTGGGSVLMMYNCEGCCCRAQGPGEPGGPGPAGADRGHAAGGGEAGLGAAHRPAQAVPGGGPGGCQPPALGRTAEAGVGAGGGLDPAPGRPRADQPLLPPPQHPALGRPAHLQTREVHQQRGSCHGGLQSFMSS